MGGHRHRLRHRRGGLSAHRAAAAPGPPLIPVRHALSVAAAAFAVAVAAFGWYLVTAEEPARPPTQAELFVADLRARQLPPSLRRTSDDDLVALGERFCDALRRTGSSLEVVFQDQLAGRVYDGESEVVTSARRHLCADLPDRDAR